MYYHIYFRDVLYALDFSLNIDDPVMAEDTAYARTDKAIIIHCGING